MTGWAEWADGSDASIVTYLADKGAALVRETQPKVPFEVDTWLEWLDEADPAIRKVAGSRLKSYAGAIGRQDLEELSKEARRTDEWTTLFVMTLVWGRGKKLGYLKAHHIDAIRTIRRRRELLAESAKVVDMEGAMAAYEHWKEAKVPGLGESFFTKWLYAAGLSSTVRPSPLVLDRNVRLSLCALGVWLTKCAEEAGFSRAGGRYAYFVDRAALWARELGEREGFRRATAYNVEHALFALGRDCVEGDPCRQDPDDATRTDDCT